MMERDYFYPIDNWIRREEKMYCDGVVFRNLEI